MKLCGKIEFLHIPPIKISSESILFLIPSGTNELWSRLALGFAAISALLHWSI